jgi:AcrR family transcriptional regulator
MQRRTTQGQGLTRERVLEAGLNVIDREGIDALTMRRLATALGVKAMSLYGYVDNKQDLLDGVLDHIYAEVPLRSGPGPAPGNGHDPLSWQDQLRTTAQAFRQVLLRHPNAVPLVAARPVMATGPQRALLQGTVDALGAAGLDVVHASAVVTVVLSFTIGHVANEVGRTGHRPAPGDPVVDVPDYDTEFRLGLDFIVTGVQDLVTPLPKPTHPKPPTPQPAAP